MALVKEVGTVVSYDARAYQRTKVVEECEARL